MDRYQNYMVYNGNCHLQLVTQIFLYLTYKKAFPPLQLSYKIFLTSMFKKSTKKRKRILCLKIRTSM